MYFYYREDQELSPDLQLLRENAHRFALETVRPAAIAADRLGNPCDAVQENSPFCGALREAYARRYHAAALPQRLNGLALPGLGLQALFEEIGWGDAGLASTILATALPFIAVGISGKQKLADELVIPFVNDTTAKLVGCWAFTEPEGGSIQMLPTNHSGIPPALSVSATTAKNGYIVRGLKAVWVANAEIASHALTYVRLDESGKPQNALLVIPLDSVQFSRGYPTNKIGQRALSQGDLMFHDAVVPKQYLLAAGDAAEQIRAELLSLCHAVTSAIMTGVARAAFEEALVFSQQRVSGGKLISDHQLVQNRLFELFTKVEACRALSRSVFRRCREGRFADREYPIAAKIFCSEAAFQVTNHASQLFGAAGLAKESLVEKLSRDARMSLVEYGTNDVLSLLGTGHILGQPREWPQ